MSVFNRQEKALRVENEAIVPAAGENRAPHGLRRIYLLVHGFNNTPEQASENYANLRERLKEFIGTSNLERIWDFYWPGYEERYKQIISWRALTEPRNSIVTAYFYYKQVPKAEKAGKLLGSYILQLHNWSRQTEVILIGHSLGCRVILEALQWMQNRTHRGTVPSIVLMAAAVPVSAVEQGGALRKGVEFSPERFVFFSHRDFVLWGCFPAGQRMAKDGGAFPKAVGRRGAPDKCWTGRRRTYLFHSQYWRHECTTDEIVHLFGKSTPHRDRSWMIEPTRLHRQPGFPEWQPRVWDTAGKSDSWKWVFG